MSDAPSDPEIIKQRNPWRPENRSYQIVMSMLRQLPDQGKMATFFEQLALAHVLVSWIDIPTHRRYILVFPQSSTYPDPEKEPAGAETWVWMYLVDMRTGEGIFIHTRTNGALTVFGQMGIRTFMLPPAQAWKGHLEDGMQLIRRAKMFTIVLRPPHRTRNRVHLEPVKQKKARGIWKGMRFPR